MGWGGEYEYFQEMGNEDVGNMWEMGNMNIFRKWEMKMWWGEQCIINGYMQSVRDIASQISPFPAAILKF